MKIETSTVTKLKISGVDRLDPVSVIVENFEPGKGKIIIGCFVQFWSYYWGVISGKSLDAFFRGAGNLYLIEKLAPNTPYRFDDEG